MSKKDKRTDDIDIDGVVQETVKGMYDAFYDEDDEYMDDYIDDSEDDFSPKNKKRKGKKVLIILGIIFALLIAVYLGIAMFFNSHFMFHTKINGVDFSLKKASEVEEYMRQHVSEYVLTLDESDGTQEEIKGTDIEVEYATAEDIIRLVQGQEKFFWIKSLWEPSEIETTIGVTFNEKKLTEILKTLKCADKKNQKSSKSAYPEYKDTKFEIVPEVYGTKLDQEKFLAAVKEAIHGFQTEMNLVEKECYIPPKYLSDSKEVAAAADKMNSYLTAKITYDFGENKEVVDAEQIAKWLKVDKKNMKVSFKKDSVQEYIKSLAGKYDTKYKAKKFTTARGNTVTVEGGAYGWQINQDKEYSQLLNDIKKGKVVTREPKYASKAASRNGAGVGSRYAEVDLTNQKMYFIKDGKVVLESDVVTGNPNKGNGTPQGVYTLSYKTLDAVLRGERRPDGTYSYESPVKYWMPFNGGIGFHDATWQSSFGGNRYRTHGSHGCVNMPKEKAGKLYSLIDAGTPVVCYY